MDHSLSSSPVEEDSLIQYNKHSVCVMVIFTCRLDWPQNAQIADKALFLSVSVRVSLEDIII